MTVGEEIKRLRNEKGFSTTKLAEMSGVSKGYISQFENDKFKPSPEILLKLASSLGVSKLHLYRVAGLLDDTDILELVDENKNLRKSLQRACNSLGADIEDYL